MSLDTSKTSTALPNGTDDPSTISTITTGKSTVTTTTTTSPLTDLPFQTPILTLRNNITIRSYHPTDAEPMAYHANNRKIWLNLQDRFPHPYHPSNATFWISQCRTLPSHPDTSHPSYPSDYALCHNNIPIGCIGLEPHDRYTHTVSLGYWIGESYWGQGIVTEAAGAFLRWSFEVFPWLVRVQADAYGWNAASMRILEKIGMKREGRLRLAVCKDGKLTDLVLFGCLREDLVGGMVEGGSGGISRAEVA